jgi:hypothetical protein
MRYDADWLLESLLLSIKSPKAYAHLRKENILPLPSPSVLLKMIIAVSGDFGFNEFAIKDLADYMRNRPLNERFCSLMRDEITISSELKFNKNTTKENDLFKIIIKALILPEEAGARILSLVCDGAQKNVTVWNQLKVTGKTGEVGNKFAHPTQDETPVYCLRDVPHLLKSLRNHLFNHKNVQVLATQTIFR